MNAKFNKAFLNFTDAATRAAILQNIASNYGITKEEVYEELTSDDAEHLLDYLTDPFRWVIIRAMRPLHYSDR
jgi:hypothetical protein